MALEAAVMRRLRYVGFAGVLGGSCVACEAERTLLFYGTAGAAASSQSGGAPAGGAGGVAGNANDAGGGATAVAVPPANASWQMQLSDAVDTSLDVSFYVIDALVERSPVQELKAAQRLVACYVSVGTFEPWRDDAAAFPQRAVGEPLDDYPNERWLDIRDATVRSLMLARLDEIASQGCDSVQVSSLEGHAVESGFPLTLADGLDYAQFLGAESHRRGLSVGLSASSELVRLAEPFVDWGLAEECLTNADCEEWAAFSDAGKPVFLVEFGDEEDAAALCPQAARLGFNLLIKRPSFDAFRVACP